MAGELHGGLAPLGTLSASFRIAAGSAANAGGYFELSSLVFFDGTRWIANGPDAVIQIKQTSANATPYGLELGAGGFVDGSFYSLLTASEIRISAGRNSSWGGHLTFYTDTTEKLRLTTSGHLLPGFDNVQTNGSAAFRWSTIYAGTGTINTSDEREKTWRGGLTKAELKAATRIIGELGFYQWNDAIAEKGDGARYHFGARAQRVWAIMAEEKLVAKIGSDGRPGKTPYAFLCFDQWEDQNAPELVEKNIPAKMDGDKEVEPARVAMVETGKTIVRRAAGERYGLRIDELTMFLVAAQEHRLAALEAILANAE